MRAEGGTGVSVGQVPAGVGGRRHVRLGRDMVGSRCFSKGEMAEMHDAVLRKGVSGVGMLAGTARASIVCDLLFSASDRV